MEYSCGRLHQHLRPSQCRLPQSLQNLREPLAAAPFIVRLVSGRQAPQMRDQLFPAGYSVSPNLPGNAGPQYLLGSSWTHLQERLQGLPVHPGPRKVAKFRNGLV
jgi:hypothetical protein